MNRGHRGFNEDENFIFYFLSLRYSQGFTGRYRPCFRQSNPFENLPKEVTVENLGSPDLLPIDDLYYPKDLLKHWSLSGVDVGVFRPIPGKYRPPGGLVSLWPHHRGRVRIHWTIQREILDAFPSLPVIIRLRVLGPALSPSDRKWTGNESELDRYRISHKGHGIRSWMHWNAFSWASGDFYSVDLQGSCISLRTQNQSKMDLLLLQVIAAFPRSACHQGLMEMRQRIRDSRIQPIVTDPSQSVRWALLRIYPLFMKSQTHGR